MVALAIQAQPYCSDCGATADLTGDHITPRSRGGLNTPTNIRVLCRSCNSSKGAKPGTSQVHAEKAHNTSGWSIA
jgi:5-methylcytosine-specific restriction endonuclease McrA